MFEQSNDKKKKVCLPIIYPPVNAYPHQGVIFSILFAREECIPWIYNNFIQTFSVKNMYQDKIRSGTVDFFYNQYGDWKYFELKANPWIRLQSIPYSMYIDYSIDIVDFIKKCLNKGQYLFCMIDRFYIPAYQYHYNKIHAEHEMLIYGYDDDNGYFLMSDNTVNTYIQATVKYNEFLESFYSINNMFVANRKKFDYAEKSLFILTIMKNVEIAGRNQLFQKETFCINTHKIKAEIKEYLLNAEYGCGYRNSEYYAYGIECYNELQKLIDYAWEENKYIDFRGFYSFMQHKELMQMRIEYLKGLYHVEEILASYKKIPNQFMNIISMALKYNMKIDLNERDIEIIHGIKLMLEEIKEKETMLLNYFIQVI